MLGEGEGGGGGDPHPLSVEGPALVVLSLGRLDGVGLRGYKHQTITMTVEFARTESKRACV